VVIRVDRARDYETYKTPTGPVIRERQKYYVRVLTVSNVVGRGPHRSTEYINVFFFFFSNFDFSTLIYVVLFILVFVGSYLFYIDPTM